MTTQHAPVSSTTERRGDARTTAILEAALALIAELGYDRVTIDAIAGRARASKTTVYRRWTTKAELVADALRRHAQGEAPVVPDTGSLRGDLLATVAQITATLDGQHGPSLIGLVEALRDDPALREQVTEQVRERSHEVGREICARAAARGEAITDAASDHVFDLAFDHLFATTLLDGSSLDVARQRTFVDTVLVPLLTTQK